MAPDFDRVATSLAEHYPDVPGPVSRDPFELILWEQVAYLAKDATRQRAFNALQERVGTTPQEILAAPMKTLQAVARMGGSIASGERAERMKKSAEMAPTLKDLARRPLPEARKCVARFPMIGAPGTDKLLLFTRLFNVFALESNGLRVLLRLGFGKEGKDYGTSYTSVMDAIAPQLPQAIDDRIALHGLLRQHGLSLCKRNTPACDLCSLRPNCPFGRTTSDPWSGADQKQRRRSRPSSQ